MNTTTSYWKSEAARWEEKFLELKEVAKRLAQANIDLKEQLMDARADAAAAKAAADEAQRNLWAA